MSKKFSGRLLPLFLPLFTIFYSFGTYSGTGVFTKISTLSEVTDGYYVVAYGTTFAMTNTNGGSYFSNTAITPNANSLTNPATTMVWEIKSHVDGGKTIYNEASSKYVSYTGTTNAAYAVSTISGGSERWNFALSGSLFSITNVTSSTRLLQYNTSSPRFACYTGTQQNITLYKMEQATCTPSNLSFAQSNISKLVSDGSFTQTATSLNATTPITYSSSNQSVATVNETTGVVTILSAGSTTITATQAAGTHNAVSYCASTATYTLDVAATAPTITVTEVVVPTLSAYAGATDTENIQVSGVNLTAGISLAISGTDANLFSLSSNSVAQSGTVIIYYSPVSPGTHTATLTLSSAGATDVVRTLNGTSSWAPLLTPVANAASNVSNTGFTANWDAVSGATEYQLSVKKVSGSASNASDLFISEYGEGTSNNKYIEIFNGTGSTVDLSAYTLKQSNNGNGWNADANASVNLPLSGTLANNDVYVVANASANASILAQADLSIAYNNAVQGGTLPSFNGNDAIGLFKNGVLIDVFGDVAGTTNFNIAGTASASLDHTIVRKSSVSGGNVNWTNSAGTNADDSEWIINSIDTWTNLGSHTFVASGFSETPIAGSPFTVVGDNTKTLSGLEAANTYKYNVIAKNTNVTSAVSNIISVTTSPNTAIPSVNNNESVYSLNSKVFVKTAIGNSIEIYNSVGQLLMAKKATNNINIFSIGTNGVIIVKTNNKVHKLIL